MYLIIKELPHGGPRGRVSTATCCRQHVVFLLFLSLLWLNEKGLCKFGHFLMILLLFIFRGDGRQRRFADRHGDISHHVFLAHDRLVHLQGKITFQSCSVVVAFFHRSRLFVIDDVTLSLAAYLPVAYRSDGCRDTFIFFTIKWKRSFSGLGKV